MPRERKGSILDRDGNLYAGVQFTDENGKKRDITRKADSRAHARQIIRQPLKEIESSTPKQLDAANMITSRPKTEKISAGYPGDS